VQLDTKWLHRTGTAVAISRSENRWLYVLGLAVLGAAGGCLFVMLLHAYSRAKLLTTAGRVAIAGVISVAVGAYVAYTTNYLNQDVWTLGANTIALLTAAFTAATSGHLVTGLLGKVYDDHAQMYPKEDGAPASRMQRLRQRVRQRKARQRRAEPAEAATTQQGRAGAPARRVEQREPPQTSASSESPDPQYATHDGESVS
jgi:hypothetical protein